MKWFGPEAFSHACDATEQSSVPLTVCSWCDEPFVEDDSGYLIPYMAGDGTTEIAYHVECWQRQFIGSLAHVEGRCSCYVAGARETDPPDLTLRQAAVAAVETFRRLAGGRGI